MEWKNYNTKYFTSLHRNFKVSFENNSLFLVRLCFYSQGGRKAKVYLIISYQSFSFFLILSNFHLKRKLIGKDQQSFPSSFGYSTANCQFFFLNFLVDVYKIPENCGCFWSWQELSGIIEWVKAAWYFVESFDYTQFSLRHKNLLKD